MTFWDIFIGCLTGLGAMIAAMAVIGPVVVVLLWAIAKLADWLADRL